MSTFCLDCVVYSANGSLLENVSRIRSHLVAENTLASITSAISTGHFYSLPSVLTFGLVFSAFNAACLAKSCKTSFDCFLACLALCSVGTTGLAVAIYAPGYAETFAWYPKVIAVACGLHDWLGCAFTWCLLVWCAERRLTVRRMRRDSYCGSLQAGLAILMIIIVTLVAALPQLWIKEVQSQVEPVSSRTNATVLRIRSSNAGMRPEYAILYQCFRDLAAVIIPAPALAVLVSQLLCCSSDYHRQQRRLLKSSTTLLRSQRSEQQQQMHANRLAVTLGCSHLMLSFPMLTLLLVWGHRPYWLPEDTFRPLYQMFGVLYYTFYPMAFLLHACFLPDYRSKMRRVFCSESCRYTTYVVE